MVSRGRGARNPPESANVAGGSGGARAKIAGLRGLPAYSESMERKRRSRGIQGAARRGAGGTVSPAASSARGARVSARAQERRQREAVRVRELRERGEARHGTGSPHPSRGGRDVALRSGRQARSCLVLLAGGRRKGRKENEILIPPWKIIKSPGGPFP